MFHAPWRQQDSRQALRPSESCQSLRLEALEDRCLPSFLFPVSYNVLARPRSIAVADFNGDGLLDLAVASPASNALQVLFGKGDGRFEEPVEYQTGRFPEFVAVGDLNGDGFLDLVATNYLDNTVSVLFGRGDGTFQDSVS